MVEYEHGELLEDTGRGLPQLLTVSFVSAQQYIIIIIIIIIFVYTQ